MQLDVFHDSHSEDLPEELRQRPAAARQHLMKVAFRLGEKDGHGAQLRVVKRYRRDHVGVGHQAKAVQNTQAQVHAW